MARKQQPRVVRDRHEGKLSMPFLAQVPAPPQPRRHRPRKRAA